MSEINDRFLNAIEGVVCSLVLVLGSVQLFAGRPPHPEPKMTFLDNGEVRLGLALEPVAPPRPGETISLKSIVMQANE